MPILAIDPIAFRLLGWPVHWYGLLIGLGMVLSYLLVMREGRRKGLSEDYLSDAYFWTIILGLIGARAYYVLFRLDYYLAHPDQIIQIWHGGGAIYGAILLGTATIIYVARRYQQDLVLTLDVAAPGIMLAQAIGRWGNFVNQEAYGPETSRAFLEGLHLPAWLIDQMQIQSHYYQPTFLYESLWNLLGLALILILRRQKGVLKRGELAAGYFVWYGLGRFFIEGLRTDSLYLGPLRISQGVSAVMVVLGLAWIIIRRRAGHSVAYSDFQLEKR